MIAHMLHNGLVLAASRDDGLKPLLIRAGYDSAQRSAPPLEWVIAALMLTGLGVFICMRSPSARTRRSEPGAASAAGAEVRHAQS